MTLFRGPVAVFSSSSKRRRNSINHRKRSSKRYSRTLLPNHPKDPDQFQVHFDALEYITLGADPWLDVSVTDPYAMEFGLPEPNRPSGEGGTFHTLYNLCRSVGRDDGEMKKKNNDNTKNGKVTWTSSPPSGSSSTRRSPPGRRHLQRSGSGSGGRPPIYSNGSSTSVSSTDSAVSFLPTPQDFGPVPKTFIKPSSPPSSPLIRGSNVDLTNTNTNTTPTDLVAHYTSLTKRNLASITSHYIPSSVWRETQEQRSRYPSSSATSSSSSPSPSATNTRTRTVLTKPSPRTSREKRRRSRQLVIMPPPDIQVFPFPSSSSSPTKKSPKPPTPILERTLPATYHSKHSQPKPKRTGSRHEGGFAKSGNDRRRNGQELERAAMISAWF